MTMNVACQRFCEPDDLFGDRCACALDENDDVQTVAANYEISDEVMQRLAS